MNFLKIVKNELAKKAEIIIYGDIVDDSWNYGWENDPDVYPKNIKNMLDGLQGQDIDVHINSGGGHAFAGFAISHMLRHHQGKTTAYIDGYAASVASVIAFGCNRIIMPENAFLMIHKPMCFDGGTADDLRKCADMLDTIQRGAVFAYKAKAIDGVTEDQINEMVNAETWFTGVEAAEYFKIQVIESVAVTNCSGKMLNRWKNIPAALKSNNITNQDNKYKKMKQEVEIALAI